MRIEHLAFRIAHMPAASLGHYTSLSFIVIGRGQMTEDRKLRTENSRQKTKEKMRAFC
jgi:hypothetical protein